MVASPTKKLKSSVRSFIGAVAASTASRRRLTAAAPAPLFTPSTPAKSATGTADQHRKVRSHLDTHGNSELDSDSSNDDDTPKKVGGGVCNRAAVGRRRACVGNGQFFTCWAETNATTRPLPLCSIKVSKNHDGPTGQILLSTAAGRGEDTRQTHNNQPNKQLNTCLGHVSLECRGDRAAVALAAAHSLRGHFVCVFMWLIVVHDAVFCCINRNQLKLSHVNHNSVSQPPACACLVSTPFSKWV